VLGEALRSSQLEALLRKLLLELPEQPSPRTRARQGRALRLAALAAVHAEDQPAGGPLVLLCVNRCCEALRLAAQRADLLPVALWALAALGERHWPRLESAGVAEVGGQRWAALECFLPCCIRPTAPHNPGATTPPPPSQALLSQQPALMQHGDPQVQLPLLLLLGQAAAHGHDLSGADLGGLVGRAMQGWEALQPAVQQRVALAVCQLAAYPAAQAAATARAIPSALELLGGAGSAAQASLAAQALAQAIEASSRSAQGPEPLVGQLLQQGLLERVQQLLPRARQHAPLTLAVVRLICERPGLRLGWAGALHWRWHTRPASSGRRRPRRQLASAQPWPHSAPGSRRRRPELQQRGGRCSGRGPGPHLPAAGLRALLRPGRSLSRYR
jgi:hypothetical protein